MCHREREPRVCGLWGASAGSADHVSQLLSPEPSCSARGVLQEWPEPEEAGRSAADVPLKVRLGLGGVCG